MAMDGQYTIDSYLNHTEGIGPNNLTDFTVCLRFNVNYLKPHYSSMLSYSTYLSDDALEIGLMQRAGGILLIYYCKYRRFGQVNNFIFFLEPYKKIINLNIKNNTGLWII